MGHSLIIFWQFLPVPYQIFRAPYQIFKNLIMPLTVYMKVRSIVVEDTPLVVIVAIGGNGFIFF